MQTPDERRAYKNLRHQNRRETLMEMRGCKCEDCGIESDDTRFFDWHHVDPSEKVMKVSTSITMKWETCLKEVAKCVMLCPNCHRIRHLDEDMSTISLAKKARGY